MFPLHPECAGYYNWRDGEAEPQLDSSALSSTGRRSWGGSCEATGHARQGQVKDPSESETEPPPSLPPFRGWWSWKRALSEGALILGSVYAAIVLESWSADRARISEAEAALSQLRSELVADSADLTDILREQEELKVQYERVARWLAKPESMPSDSVHRALERLSLTNRTMFPRRGAWTSLLSSGLLTSVRDPDLVTRLGNFYEYINDRLEYNGRDYDYNLNEVTRVTLGASWDKLRRQPVGDVTRLRNELRYIQIGWNGFYLDLLQEYRIELEGLIADIDRYLGTA